MSNDSAIADRTHIKSAARSFAAAIAETAAVREYSAAVDAVRADDNALQLLQQLQQLRQTLQMNAGWDNSDSPERQRLEELEAEVAQHPVLQRFFASQKTMIDELHSINDRLRQRLGFDFASLARPACNCG
ncbi:MAG: hypothetical protein EA404_06175 [Spirochaetaceae bacterium]|nr:MAG: hypothetical protein EA404_06175 [Spirochaetaceae bacterium]